MVVNFQDPQIWITIAFILFFLVFGKLIWQKFSSFLDQKIVEINQEITEAQQLHKEAKDLLASEKKNIQNLEDQVEKIIKDSRKLSKEILLENKDKIDQEVLKIERSYQDKIKYLEQEAILDIKEKITLNSVELAVKDIRNSLNSNESHSTVIENSIKEVKQTLKKTNTI